MCACKESNAIIPLLGYSIRISNSRKHIYINQKHLCVNREPALILEIGANYDTENLEKVGKNKIVKLLTNFCCEITEDKKNLSNNYLS